MARVVCGSQTRALFAASAPSSIPRFSGFIAGRTSRRQRRLQLEQTFSLTRGEFSPIPAVKTRASSPPRDAAKAPAHAKRKMGKPASLQNRSDRAVARAALLSSEPGSGRLHHQGRQQVGQGPARAEQMRWPPALSRAPAVMRRTDALRRNSPLDKGGHLPEILI